MENLSVAAIETGTVIDHIKAGAALKIARLLKLSDEKKRVTLGLNLPSKKLGRKDLIKIEGRHLTEEECAFIAIFAKEATISIITASKLVKKFKVELPRAIDKILNCPNPKCITNHEKVVTRFTVSSKNPVSLTCCYCQIGFSYDPD